MPVLLPILLVSGAVGVGLWLWLRKAPEPEAPAVEIGTGGGTVGIVIGGGTVGGGSRAVTSPVVDEPPIVKPVVPPQTPEPTPGGNPFTPSPVIVPGSYYWVQTGDVGTRIVGTAFGLPNDSSGRRFRNWEMTRKHLKNQPLKGSSQSVWDGALEKRHIAPGQFPRGSGNQHPVIWIPTSAEIVP